MQTFKKEPMQSPKTNAYHLKKIGIIEFQSGLYHTDISPAVIYPIVAYAIFLQDLSNHMPFFHATLRFIALVGGFSEKIKIDIVKAKFCLIIGS